MPMNEAAARLVAALRAIPEDTGTPFRVPGDGLFLWDYNHTLVELPGGSGSEVDYPEGFCGSAGCAMGLAFLMGLTGSPDGAAELGEAVGLAPEDANEVFYCADTYGVSTFEEVTAAMVADELEGRLRCP